MGMPCLVCSRYASLCFADDAKQKGNYCQDYKYMYQARGAPYKNTQHPTNYQDHRKDI